MTDQEYLAQLQESEATEKPEQSVPSNEGLEALELAVGTQKLKLPLTTEFPVTHDGQLTKVPLSTILNHYRQRADLEKKFIDLRGQREAFEKERGSLDEFQKLQKSLEPYKQLQEWSEGLEKTNPVGYRHLLQTIEHLKNFGVAPRGATSNEEAPVAGFDTSVLSDTISGLRKELEEIRSWKSQQEQRAEQEENQKAWQQVQNEKAEFGKKYPEINLDEKDPEGRELWVRIIDWGRRNGYQDFRPAAFAFLEEKIAESLASRGRNEVVKNVQKKHKDGVVARSDTPFGDGQGPRPDFKKMGYDDLGNWALEQLGASKT